MNTIRLALIVSIGFLFAQPLQAQDSSPGVGDSSYVAGDYRVFTGAGQPASLEDVVAMMGHNEVVFIGETHDDPGGQR